MTTNGFVTVTERSGDLRAGAHHSTGSTSRSRPRQRILDAERGDGLLGSDPTPTDVTGVNITLTAGTGRASPAASARRATSSRSTSTHRRRCGQSRRLDTARRHDARHLPDRDASATCGSTRCRTRATSRCARSAGSIVDARNERRRATTPRRRSHRPRDRPRHRRARREHRRPGAAATTSRSTRSCSPSARRRRRHGATSALEADGYGIYLTETDGDAARLGARRTRYTRRRPASRVRESTPTPTRTSTCSASTASPARFDEDRPAHRRGDRRRAAHDPARPSSPSAGSVLLRVGDDVTHDHEQRDRRRRRTSTSSATARNADPHFGTTMVLRGTIIAGCVVRRHGGNRSPPRRPDLPDADLGPHRRRHASSSATRPASPARTTLGSRRLHLPRLEDARRTAARTSTSTGDDGEDRFIVYYLQTR